MAVIWKTRVKDTHYEVRAAGGSRRLYTDGVFHSQFNPSVPLTGSVWDLLMLPAFFYREGGIRRALVLGVGGGTVLHQLRGFVRPEVVTGIDSDRTHLHVARRFFGLRGRGIELHHADARDWLERYEGPRFDMIVDDVFGGTQGVPARTVPANTRWFELLLRRLTRHGLIVMNFDFRPALHRCAYFTNRKVRRRFPSAFTLTNAGYDNVVAAFLRTEASSRDLRRRVCGIRELDPRRRSSRLRYRIRRVSAASRA